MVGFKNNKLEECKMATVGQSLTAPEAGWQRYDDTDSNISYKNAQQYPNDKCYNGHFLQGINAEYTFNFTGTKFRFIGFSAQANSEYTNKGIIKLDGNIVTTFDQQSDGGTDTYQLLQSDIPDLSNGEHYCQIYCNDSGKLLLDAIDIDENGELKPFNPNLGNALLRVTMNDSSEREYQLSSDEIFGFVNWHQNHSSTDTASYMLNKKIGLQSSKDYLAFNKIISFEVTPLPAE